MVYHINDLVTQYNILAAQRSRALVRDLTEDEQLKIKFALLRQMSNRVGRSKYTPHQGKQECARRVRRGN